MPTAIFIASKGQGNWTFADLTKDGHVLSKMEHSGIVLDKIASIQRGFEIGRDKVLSEGDYPFLTGSDVQKYTYSHVRFISEETYHTYSKDKYFYSGPRLLLRETGSYLTVLYLEEEVYSNRSLYSIKINDKAFSTKYVLACLNSKACQFYYSSKFKSDTELFPKIRIKQARMLPIPFATKSTQDAITSVIDSILTLLHQDINSDISIFENQLDKYVYHLYGLSYDEVLTVDPQTSISREEYNDSSHSVLAP